MKLWLAASAIAPMLIFVPVQAQLPSISDVHAIVGARIVVRPGQVIAKGTVVIRDGLIEAVGVDIKAPPEAEIVKGEGLTVYAGFVDAYTNKGLKLPDAIPDQDTPPDYSADVTPAMRVANRKRIRPELQGSELFSMSEADQHAIRKTGFTTLLVVPSGSIVNGNAALINLSAAPKRDQTLAANVGLSFAFRVPLGSGYPDSILGVFSQLRQAIIDAGRFSVWTQHYAKGGTRRPPDDAVLRALLPAIRGSQTILWEADTVDDVDRALRVSLEFGWKPVLVGGANAWKRVGNIHDHAIGVIVGLKFNDEVKPAPEPKAEAKPVAKPDQKPEIQPDVKADAKPTEPASPEGDPLFKPIERWDDLPEPLKDVHQAKWLESVNNLKVLVAAGVPLALTTRGCKDLDEFWKNLRRAVKEGLSQDAALAALTIGPAKLLGVDRTSGTVEVGKTATLTIVADDLWTDKGKVKFTFVDGKKFDAEREPKSPKAEKPGGGDRHD